MSVLFVLGMLVVVAVAANDIRKLEDRCEKLEEEIRELNDRGDSIDGRVDAAMMSVWDIQKVLKNG